MEFQSGSSGDDFPWPDTGQMSGPLEKWMEELLVEALVAQGCPLYATRSIVRFATLATYPQSPWLLDVLDHWHFGPSVEVRREEFAQAALDVAEMIRDSNAEAVRRQRQGEDGPPPYWEIPDSPDTPPSA